MIPSILALVVLAAPAAPQSFKLTSNKIPGGPTFNDNPSDNVDFADVDLDGDLDCVIADGGDVGNAQNRMWINFGGAQGGSTGSFQDQTAQRFPALLDNSRDLDFADIDGDGDQDLYSSNTSSITNQTSRWWVNVGGSQGGNAGFFVDESDTRWVDLGINNGTTSLSSLPASAVLPGGGFTDWSCDCVFADLDNDGDMDLVHSSYGAGFGGKNPTRLYLNDGLGFYKEFNPSGAQLLTFAIPDGTPGLWCEGSQKTGHADSTGVQCDISDAPLSVDVGDLDGDLDLDFLMGSRFESPRLFENRLSENGGTLGFRDVTASSFTQAPVGGSIYDMEFGDLDGDMDLDVYGLNWGVGTALADDVVATNDGSGTFVSFDQMAMSQPDANEADWIDYDGDGDLDAFVAGSTAGLWRNPGPPSWFPENVSQQELPSAGSSEVGVDVADVDGDGDDDMFVAVADGPNLFYENITQKADTHAPYVGRLEQAPDRLPGAAPTVIRVQVYDNTSWTVTQFADVRLEHSIDGGAWTASAMSFSGGQIFRGELSGALTGVVGYRVKAIDQGGNTVLSKALGYAAGPACAAAVTTYCTSSTNSQGCTPMIASSGSPSLSSGQPFVISASQVVASSPGTLIYTTTGSASVPAFGGFLCLATPLFRSPPVQAGGSAACSGLLSIDFNAMLGANGAPDIWPGQQMWCQYWSRDVGAPSGAHLTDALTFLLCP